MKRTIVAAATTVMIIAGTGTAQARPVPDPEYVPCGISCQQPEHHRNVFEVLWAMWKALP